MFIGCVGKDESAEKLAAGNRAAGLEYCYRYDEQAATGRCGVVITGHNRSMCTDLAAANCYKLEHLKENWGLVEKSKALFVGGYHLTVSVDSIMALCEEAATKNKVSPHNSWQGATSTERKDANDRLALAIHSVPLRTIHSPILQGTP